MEAIADFRTFKSLRAGGIRRQDKHSRMVLLYLLVSGIILGVLLAYKLDAAAITTVPDLFFWLGIFFMSTGIGLRFYAINMLGAFFTTTLAVAPDQTVVESGPYRLIRHPSYTGLLLILLGFGLSFTNWLSVLAIIGCAVIGLSYRIRVEERFLQEALGQRYQEYMQRTKRLIPFVL